MADHVRTRETLTSRWFVKSAFLALFVASCVQLLRFGAWARDRGPYVARPEAPAGILPIGHFTSFFAWLRGGGWDTLLPAGLVIILGALATSLVLKRGFCGWICPVGTVWEAFSSAGRRLMGRDLRLPRWLDVPLRGIRYVLAAAFAFVLMSVPLAEAVDFRRLPYMWTADLRILGIMVEPAFVLVVLLTGAVSALIGPVWCRYLCPLGGLYSAVALASPLAVERDAGTCTHCGRCSAVCHAFVEPERSRRVWAVECDGCMECVRACPVDGCLEAQVLSAARVPAWAWPLLVVAVWFAIWGFARLSGNWVSSIPPEEFRAVVQSGILEQETPTSLGGDQP